MYISLLVYSYLLLECRNLNAESGIGAYQYRYYPGQIVGAYSQVIGTTRVASINVPVGIPTGHAGTVMPCARHIRHLFA